MSLATAAQGSISPNGYLLMESARRRPSAASHSSVNDTIDYYNEPSIEPHSDYIDMQLVINMSSSSEGTSQRSPAENFLSSYANMCSRAYISDPDRCDSVPEMVAPPLPTNDSSGGMPIPPALPPRNPGSTASSPR